jgi:two-component system cell cycle response regulator CtrA
MIDGAKQHAIDRQRIEALEAENDELQERLRQLADRFLNSGWKAPLDFGLTGREEALLAALVGREEGMTKEQLMHAMYGLLPDGQEPEIKIIDVFICKMRKKLKPCALEIETVWGRGYRLTPESRSRLLDWNTNASARSAA